MISGYFGKKILVYHRRGLEIKFRSYKGWFRELNPYRKKKPTIRIAKSNDDLCKLCDTMFVPKHVKSA